MKTGSRSSWSGKWAFILAAAASAVGLGNMWRFPYLAAKYGGGTFLITYLVLVFTFGVSLLLLETAIGRKTGLSAIGAFRHFGKKFMFIGVLASVVPFIIVPYYCIIGGWVTKYAFAYIAAGPAAMADGGTFFSSFITDGVDSSIFMLIFMAAAFIIVARGVKGGIEKANLILMPALIVMAIAIAIFTLTLPGALDGAAYYLKPDLSKFSPELVIGALGQMFYSLSLAMGIMITYGSYLEKKASLTQSVTRIGCFDLGVSFLAGLIDRCLPRLSRWARATLSLRTPVPRSCSSSCPKCSRTWGRWRPSWDSSSSSWCSSRRSPARSHSLRPVSPSFRTVRASLAESRW